MPSAVDGSLQAPPSKSAAQRAIAIASLAPGLSVIRHPGQCDDVLSAIGVCLDLGAGLQWHKDDLHIQGGIDTPKKPLNCGESGLGLRMFSGIASSLGEEVVLTGEGSLPGRPMVALENSLRTLGVVCRTQNGYLPVKVKGPIRAEEASIDASSGSQVLTGILIAAPLSGNSLNICVENLKSKPYIDLTLELMKAFGAEATHSGYREFHIRGGQSYKATHYVVEGDWSAAAFLLVAGATAGRIRVTGLDPRSFQADRKVLKALEMAGAGILFGQAGLEVWKRKLTPFSFDATDCPDLFPPLVCLAASCRGRSNIRGIDRLSIKESDRAATLMEVFGKMGIVVQLRQNTMIIEGRRAGGATVSSHGDHRIAMAAAIAALNAGNPVNIMDAGVVNKSYPGFFEDLEKVSTAAGRGEEA